MKGVCLRYCAEEGQMCSRMALKGPLKLKTRFVMKAQGRKKRAFGRKPGIKGQDGSRLTTLDSESSLVQTEETKKMQECTDILNEFSLLIPGGELDKIGPNVMQNELHSSVSSAIEDPLREHLSSIVYYLLGKESQNIPQAVKNDKQILMSDRYRAIKNILMIIDAFKYKLDTSYLAVNIMDQVLGKVSLPGNKLTTLALTSLWIAIKYEESICPRIDNLISLYPHELFVLSEIIHLEKDILELLGFQLSYVSPIKFVELLFLKGQFSKQTKQAVYSILREILLYSVMRFYKSSIIALSCVSICASQSLDLSELTIDQRVQMKMCSHDVKHIYFLQNKQFSKNRFITR